jgi:hypothetical protein
MTIVQAEAAAEVAEVAETVRVEAALRRSEATVACQLEALAG